MKDEIIIEDFVDNSVIELEERMQMPVLENLEVTPTTEEQIFKSEKYGYNEVKVKGTEGLAEDLSVELTEQDNLITNQETTIEDIINALEDKSAGIVPEGTLDITENGEYDVFEKAIANVNVHVGVFPEGNIDITTTEEYDVTNYMTAKIKDDNLKAENIAENVEILGLKGTFKGGIDTSDATATSGDLLLGKTAYANEEKLTGTIETYDGGMSDGAVLDRTFADYSQGVITNITAKHLEGITELRNYAYYNLSSLLTIEIPSTVTKLGNRVFESCVNLTTAILPDSVTSVGEYLFQYCEKLTGVVLPKNLKIINTGMFLRCSSITNTIIPEGVTSIGTNAFGGCTGITSMVIPDTVTSMGRNVFSGCSNLASIELSNNPTRIDNGCFSGCTSLTEINIPDSVTALGGTAFQNCTGLQKVTIGTGMATIYETVFQNCTSLTEIICLAEKPPTLNATAFTGVPENCTIKVPASSVDAYKTATNWSARADYIVAYEEV